MIARTAHPLLVLKSIADAIAVRLHESRVDDTHKGTDWSALSFRSGDNLFLIAASDVQEVVAQKKLGKFTPIPQAKRWLKGLIQLRGDLLPIIDFAALVLNQAAKSSAKSRVIVTKPPLHCGFIVDEVCGVEQIAIATLPAARPALERRFLTATFQQNNLTYHVFSLKHAAADAELRNFTTN